MTKLMSEKTDYIDYLVSNGNITEKTARCIINCNNEVPPAYIRTIKNLYENAEYGRLNTVCEGITFKEVGSRGKALRVGVNG